MNHCKGSWTRWAFLQAGTLWWVCYIVFPNQQGSFSFLVYWQELAGLKAADLPHIPRSDICDGVSHKSVAVPSGIYINAEKYHVLYMYSVCIDTKHGWAVWNTLYKLPSFVIDCCSRFLCRWRRNSLESTLAQRSNCELMIIHYSVAYRLTIFIVNVFISIISFLHRLKEEVLKFLQPLFIQAGP